MAGDVSDSYRLEVAESYRSSLDDLNMNSKPQISMLTMLAEDHLHYGDEIVKVIEDQIKKVPISRKLPILYLIDSVIKNLSDTKYPQLFESCIVSMFAGVFEEVDEKTRQSMYKLRQTWVDIISNKRLYAIDVRVKRIDQAWPITAKAPEQGVIHVNPKFLKSAAQLPIPDVDTDEELSAKEKETLRLERELAETKAKLEQREKQLEKQALQAKSVRKVIDREPPSLIAIPPVGKPSSGLPQPGVTAPATRDPRLNRDPRLSRDPRLQRKETASQEKEIEESFNSPGSADAAKRMDLASLLSSFKDAATKVAEEQAKKKTPETSPIAKPLVQPSPKKSILSKKSYTSSVRDKSSSSSKQKDYVKEVPNDRSKATSPRAYSKSDKKPNDGVKSPSKEGRRDTQKGKKSEKEPEAPMQDKRKDVISKDSTQDVPIQKVDRTEKNQSAAPKSQKPKVSPKQDKNRKVEDSKSKQNEEKTSESVESKQNEGEKASECVRKLKQDQYEKTSESAKKSKQDKCDKASESVKSPKQDEYEKVSEPVKKLKQDEYEKTPESAKKLKQDEYEKASEPVKKLKLDEYVKTSKQDEYEKGSESVKSKQDYSEKKSEPVKSKQDEYEKASELVKKSKQDGNEKGSEPVKEKPKPFRIEKKQPEPKTTRESGRTSPRIPFHRSPLDRRRGYVLKGGRSPRARLNERRKAEKLKSEATDINEAEVKKENVLKTDLENIAKTKTNTVRRLNDKDDGSKVLNEDMDIDDSGSDFKSEIETSLPIQQLGISPTQPMQSPVDVDMRVGMAAPHSKRSLSESSEPNHNEEPEEKKLKTGGTGGDISQLFGAEDVDYRNLNKKVADLVPPPPMPSAVLLSPPVKSRTQVGWSQFKEKHPNDFLQETERKRLRDAQMQDAQDVDLRQSSAQLGMINMPPANQQPNDSRSRENKDKILHRAEMEVKAGRMTKEDHEALVRQVGEVYNRPKVREGPQTPRMLLHDPRIRGSRDSRQSVDRDVNVDMQDQKERMPAFRHHEDKELTDRPYVPEPRRSGGKERIDRPYLPESRRERNDFEHRSPLYLEREENSRGYRDEEAEMRRRKEGYRREVERNREARDERRREFGFENEHLRGDRGERYGDGYRGQGMGPKKRSYEDDDYETQRMHGGDRRRKGDAMYIPMRRRPISPPDNRSPRELDPSMKRPDAPERRRGYYEDDPRVPVYNPTSRSALQKLDETRDPDIEFGEKRGPIRKGEGEDVVPMDFGRNIHRPLPESRPYEAEVIGPRRSPEDEQRGVPPVEIIKLREQELAGPKIAPSLPLAMGPRPVRPGGPLPPQPAGPPNPGVKTLVKISDPLSDPRWSAMKGLLDAGGNEEVVLDDKPFELRMGTARKLQVFGQVFEVRVDLKEKGICINGQLQYKLGEPIKEVNINGRIVRLYYHGLPKPIWLDGQYHEMRVDAPPRNVLIDGCMRGFQIDGRDNMILVDRMEKGSYGGPPRKIQIVGVEHEISFHFPPRTILIDGKPCELKLDSKIPYVIIEGKPHGIRFEGEPRTIFINNQPFTIPLDRAEKIRIGQRPTYVAFGGPAHEIIIDGKWFEVKFDNTVKDIHLRNRHFSIRIPGPLPRVKILDQLPLNFDVSRLMIKNSVEVQRVMPSTVMHPVIPNARPQRLGQMPGQNPMVPGQFNVDQVRMPRAQILQALQQRQPGQAAPRPQLPRGIIPGLVGARPGMIQHQQPTVPGMTRPQQPLTSLQQGILNQVPNMSVIGQSLGLSGVIPGIRSEAPNTQQPQLVPGMQGAVIDANALIRAALSTTGSSTAPANPLVGVPPQTNLALPSTTATGRPLPAGLSLPSSSVAPSQTNTSTTTSNSMDINSLLSNLIKVGLIKKEGKTEDSAPAPAPAPIPTPQPTSTEDVKPIPFPVKKEKKRKARLPNLSDFDADLLKISYQRVVDELHEGIQCHTCSARFTDEDQVKYRAHLDWHFRQNKLEQEMVKVAKNRKWFYTIPDWIQYEELEESDEKFRSEIFEQMRLGNEQSGPGGVLGMDPQQLRALEGKDVVTNPVATGVEGEDVCATCGDSFESVWNEETEEWILKNTIKVNGKTYHPICFEDMQETPTPVADVIRNPLETELQQEQPSINADMKNISIKAEAAGIDTADVKPDIKTIKMEPEASTTLLDVKSEPVESPDYGVPSKPFIKMEPLSEGVIPGFSSDDNIKSEEVSKTKGEYSDFNSSEIPTFLSALNNPGSNPVRKVISVCQEDPNSPWEMDSNPTPELSRTPSPVPEETLLSENPLGAPTDETALSSLGNSIGTVVSAPRQQTSPHIPDSSDIQ